MRTISVADYIVEFLISKGIKNTFGYQGGMIAFLFDSLKKYENQIKYHICYNEQGCAFAANGNALVSGKAGFCFVTSGPGFTNSLTGMANAYCDSIPVIFVAGQVNYKDKKHGLPIRQKGFQELLMADIAKPICKKSYNIEKADEVVEALNEAYEISTTGRKGPVFLDIPINVFYEEISVDEVNSFNNQYANEDVYCDDIHDCMDIINASKMPVIMAGAGIKQAGVVEDFRHFIECNDIPVVTSMLAVDLLKDDDEHKMGFVGPDGQRTANCIIDRADCVLCLGARLDPRQTGYNVDVFAPNARIIRIDIDDNEFLRKIKDNEIDIQYDLNDFFNIFQVGKNDTHKKWLDKCKKVKAALELKDNCVANEYISLITEMFADDGNVFLDVGKNQLWAAQSTRIKNATRVFLSGGLGSMGFSLPAAIGAAFESDVPVYSISGDGGIQMNIQEFQTIKENDLNVKIIVINNHALANVAIFQDRWLESRYVATMESMGDYHSADICRIAEAYDIKGIRIKSLDEISSLREVLFDRCPCVIEISIPDDTPVLPDIPADKDALRADGKLDDVFIETIEAMLS